MVPSAHLDNSDNHATKPVPKEGTGALPHPQGEDNKLVVATRSSGYSASVDDASAPVAADIVLSPAPTNTSNIQALPVAVNSHSGVAVDVSVAGNGASIEFSVEPHGDGLSFEAVQHLLGRAAGRDAPNMNAAVVAHAAASLAHQGNSKSVTALTALKRLAPAPSGTSEIFLTLDLCQRPTRKTTSD
ncbi:hypothetical protein HMN09_00306400 [Mycena chlorophos]|uniref:Uncharacterized protein n=1 Tax=Mycena chlorophos TaxID=658473 RepID=A0A8H6WPD4_MYCCL|nr:hypothetical protein HMN09_00306400 [Mycena chlorophos]